MQDITYETALVLFQHCTRYATNSIVCIFDANVFGKECIVKVRHNENTVSVQERNGNLHDQILFENRRSSMKLTIKRKVK